MLYLTGQFFLAALATCGFAVIFRVPWKHIVPCSIVGAFGWVAYKVALSISDSPVVGCFIGACIVGLLSTISAYMFKDATTIFIIPGILCLVPGNNIYLTMMDLLHNDIGDFTNVGVQTLMMAGAIALGLLVMGAALGVIRLIAKRTVDIGEKIRNVNFLTSKNKSDAGEQQSRSLKK